MNRNSLRYWLPHLRHLRIPHPRTIIVPIGSWWYPIFDGKPVEARHFDRLQRSADRIGYPCFMRTDYLSGKHDYERSCLIEKPEDVTRNLAVLLEHHLMVFGVPDPTAICFREFLRLESTFRAFQGLPIAREWRFFVRDGQPECEHFYWPEDAIEDYGHRPALPDDWRERLQALRADAPPEQTREWAQRISRRLGGAWSVDVAYDVDGRWWLIDMAEADRSWHPEHRETEAMAIKSKA